MENDKLRFRVWDDNNKKYIFNHDEICITQSGLFAIYDRPLLTIWSPFAAGIIIEQCTGLSDKNGKLIYIGDIIKCGDGPFRTATVEYANGENFIDGIYPFNLYHDCGDECHCQLRDYPEYACEIIGNIHEQNKGVK